MAENENTPTASEAEAPKKKGTRRRHRPTSPQIFVNIDKENIAGAVRRDSRHCMIAEAIHAAAPDLANVMVDIHSIRASDPKRRLRFSYATPRIAALALIDFDQGVMLEPFSFWLRRPATITRQGPRPGRPDNDTPKAQRLKTRAERARNARVVMDQIRAPNLDEPFKPPREYAEKVVAAMEDPEAPLGPAVMLDPPNGGAPITVGGTAPRHHGRAKLIRTRKFGLRESVP